MGPGGLVQAVQGPYESGAELFSCIFQLLKFPRRATVCKRGGEMNNGWIKTEAGPQSTLKVDLCGCSEGKPSPDPALPSFTSPVSWLLSYSELNENAVTMFLGVQAALYLSKIDEQIHQRKLTLGKNTQVTLRAK